MLPALSQRMDLYAIPFRNQYVIYRPLRHLAFIGNQALVEYLHDRVCGAARRENPKIEEFLDSVGFWRQGLSCTALTNLADWRPSQAVLLMTTRCNLRCVYCYASGGTRGPFEDMSWPLAQAVIDAAVGNARQSPGVAPGLTFHGGGEPTMHWDLLVQAVEYAQEREPSFRVSMSSNGVWSETQRRFICAHFSNVSLSMDGAPHVQDRQRPFPTGAGSLAVVMENVAALDEANIDYGIRMTVLPDTVADLVEGVHFLCEHTRAAAIQIEPTFTNERGHYSDLDPGFADAFSAAFIEGWRAGQAAGRSVYYSGARPWVIAAAFCTAPLQALVATPDGRLVTCFEVFSGALPGADACTIGRVSAAGVAYEPALLESFLAHQQASREECRDCFCYWHCCGDCVTRRRGSRSGTSGRCRTTRTVTLELLLAYMAEGDGIWQGLREEDEYEQPDARS